MAVPVKTTSEFEAGSPSVLFEGRYAAGGGGRNYDVSLDGKRFLIVKEAAPSGESTPRITVVQNWLKELKRLVPIGN